ncbi:hypothetical protein [Mesorhizobium sp. CAU 1741]|uniref:hypothetical protein n=1 Tax=Mesorhizobium sp. CAU 1741 TaxID=3140366 RepID=UPI00325B287D
MKTVATAMLKPLALCITVTAAILCSAANADEVDDAIASFINADGFAQEDAEIVDGELVGLFSGSGAMRPDGAASPVEKALLLIDSMEAPLSRVRYMVRYGQMIQADTPLSFVTVERYNFGPIIRQQVIDAYGEENADTPDAFGVGPHVAWRIVTMPLMGQTAAVIEAARREIGDEEAEGLDCGGRGCLSYSPTPDEMQLWDEVDGPQPMETAYEESSTDDVAVPARAAAELTVAASLASNEGNFSWHGPEQPEAARGAEPFLFVTIDRDLGQDTSVDAVLGQTLLNDDAIDALWHRRAEFPGSVYWMRAATQKSR